jgi:endothelin-converting enzyme/putative endopeptidase
VGVGRLGLIRIIILHKKRYERKRDKYEQHIARMLQFIGETEAKASAAKILALEIKMSNPRLDRVERRDGRLQYNPMTIAELQKMTPAIGKTILQVLVLQNWIP